MILGCCPVPPGLDQWPIHCMSSASARAAHKAAVDCFGSVAAATEAIAIAVRTAVKKRAAGSAGKPIAGINSPLRGDWIIETVNALIAGGAGSA